MDEDCAYTKEVDKSWNYIKQNKNEMISFRKKMAINRNINKVILLKLIPGYLRECFQDIYGQVYNDTLIKMFQEILMDQLNPSKTL